MLMEENYSESVMHACGVADVGNNVNITNMSKEQPREVAASTKVHYNGNEVLSDISNVDILESKLAVGQIVKSVDEAYSLYCSYAHAKGFSVRKGNQSYFNRSSDLRSKEFLCSCEGKKDDKSSKDHLLVHPRSSTRTDCKAWLKITREREGEWKVSRFDKEHNHEMLRFHKTRLLRSSRNIFHAKSSTLEAMVNPGIGVVNKYLDHLKRHTELGNGGASALIQYFIDKSKKEPNFYWDAQEDGDNKVMNFFFRDRRCLVDYEYFGDVVLVDSTYKSNWCNLVCIPFVGINHHKQNVMFGLALMSDETDSSFEWLFNTFLDSMNRKEPETIFSDHCETMMNAIETVFQEAHHRLCHRRINENAHSQLWNLDADTMFKELWHKCMSECDSEEEFEATWKFMTDIYDLSGHNWLNKMYKLRHKWANAFSNGKFSAGLCNISNFALKIAASSIVTLYDVVFHLEKILNSWRTAESIEDSRRLLGKPSPISKGLPHLVQVADICSLKIYKMFESELMECINTRLVGQPLASGDHCFEFKVQSVGESSTIKKVVLDKQNCVIKCSCHKFETVGILCKHALTVLCNMNVKVLPEQYLKRRWMKNAKNRLLDEVGECERTHSDASSDPVVVVEESKLFDDALTRNPQRAKTSGIVGSSTVCNRDNGERGKGKAYCSNAEATKRKRPWSQDEATHVQNSQETSHALPPQGPTGNSLKFQPFASQFEINQSQPFGQYRMQDSGNILA